MSKDFSPISMPLRSVGTGAKEALILGAGGAARAVVFGLIQRGFERIHVANRTLERAQALREKFGDTVIPSRWDQIPALLPRVSLLVNTTSLGHAGSAARSTSTVLALRNDVVVSDLVYVPLIDPCCSQAAQVARPAHGGRPWHAAASGRSGLFVVVRRAGRKLPRNCVRSLRPTSPSRDFPFVWFARRLPPIESAVRWNMPLASGVVPEVSFGLTGYLWEDYHDQQFRLRSLRACRSCVFVITSSFAVAQAAACQPAGTRARDH